jgi:hypothetical protein
LLIGFCCIESKTDKLLNNNVLIKALIKRYQLECLNCGDMYNFYFRSIFILVVACFFNSASFGNVVFIRDTTDCLEISGVVTKDGKPQTEVTVKLWLENEPLATIDLKKAFKFKFVLKKDANYSIIISKPGFITRIVSVSTKLPKDASTESLFRFYFELELVSEKENHDPFYEDFPTAHITYNTKLDAFENDDKYSQNIKKAMIKKNK